MVKVIITHDRDLCVGCGACAAICPDNWEMAEDGKASAKKLELDEVGCNKQAAESCPVQCIHVKEVE